MGADPGAGGGGAGTAAAGRSRIELSPAGRAGYDTGVREPPGTGPEVPMTGMKPDRTVADQTSRQMMREKEAALKKKRAGCTYHAKIQNLSMLERRRFIRDCMSF